MQGGTLSLPKGYRLNAHVSLDSTNSEAMRLAVAGEQSGLWVWSESQQAGRGRSGRTWESLPGNLFCSLLLRPSCAITAAPELGFVAGVALHDAVTQLSQGNRKIDVRLKWPNDLLLNGKKAGGILLESQKHGDTERTVIVGIGLNVAAYPEDAAYPSASLQSEGITTTPATVLERMSQRFDLWYRTWNNGDDFASIREVWLERSLDNGTNLTVKCSNRASITGTFDGVDAQGALILTLEDGQKKHITAGDVFPL